jgi:hypothetical protein
MFCFSAHHTPRSRRCTLAEQKCDWLLEGSFLWPARLLLVWWHCCNVKLSTRTPGYVTVRTQVSKLASREQHIFFSLSLRRILIYTLSRVRGSMTNNNGFWIGWLDLLTPSFIFTLSYSQLQQLTINLLPRNRSILVLLLQFSYNFWTQLLNSTAELKWLSVLTYPPFITSGRTE